jgi:NAD(P)-dependent dehydrogenase (short-subunit alcohol dehydrogenase family)
MRLEGKVALISGAATGVLGEPMGFGGASAWLFVREGAKVVLVDINEEGGNRTAAQIRESGGEALFVRLDVTREQNWIDAIRTTVEETTEVIWDGQMAVHAKGVFLGTKHAIPEMRKIGGGSIVNISSIMGIVGASHAPAYSAAKGAIRLFTKAAAIQYAGQNIRVNSVHPGYVVTPLTQAFFSDPVESVPRLATVPAGRFGTADEIASGILFLASDESSYMTGSELVIDGGMTAR